MRPHCVHWVYCTSISTTTTSTWSFALGSCHRTLIGTKGGWGPESMLVFIPPGLEWVSQFYPYPAVYIFCHLYCIPAYTHLHMNIRPNRRGHGRVRETRICQGGSSYPPFLGCAKIVFAGQGIPKKNMFRKKSRGVEGVGRGGGGARGGGGRGGACGPGQDIGEGEGGGGGGGV